VVVQRVRVGLLGPLDAVELDPDLAERRPREGVAEDQVGRARAAEGHPCGERLQRRTAGELRADRGGGAQ
jgi:hypothetical protein